MPAKLPDKVHRDAVELYVSGLSTAKVARHLGIDTSTVADAVRRAGVTRTLSSARNLFLTKGGQSWNRRRSSGSEGVIMDPLIDPGEYAALAYCTYLNQASLGLIPRTSLEASVRFLADVA